MCQVLPVNRLFTVDAGKPTPDLKCVVGFHSIEEEVKFFDSTQLEVESILKVTWRMNCSEAHTKEMVLSKVNVDNKKITTKYQRSISYFRP